MRYFIAYLAFIVMISAGFFHVLNSTLMDMTRRDCLAGRTGACEQLQQAGVRP